MTLPSPARLYDVVAATWPAATVTRTGPWLIRDGQAGGQRTMATTAAAAFSSADLSTAEAAMSALGQPSLFMIRDDAADLDALLAANGYQIKDPVTAYTCPVATVTGPLPPVSAFAVWPPLQIMRDLWAEGGIGPGRLAVMNRVTGPKTAILARTSGRAAGTAFVAIHDDIAMIHAIEVTPSLRRKGAGATILRSAANWAAARGALYFSLVVTDANTGANALYKGLGLTPVARYHYRIKPD